jgi:hypothetical protein
VSGGVNLSVCVQHHPARAHLIPQLVDRLGGNVEVVTDPDPDNPQASPLRCYLECLRRTPAAATHRVVVQDDAYPADDFQARLAALVGERPDDMLALFVPGASPHRGVMMGARLVTSWVPTVALVWPVARAAEFVAAEAEKVSTPRRPRTGDDGPVGKWATAGRVAVWAPVPSIVEHPDVEPSLIGRKAMAGRNRMRVAAFYDGT